MARGARYTSPMRFLLLSLALAGAVPSNAAAPDEIAEIYRDQKNAAFVYRHRVEFYDLKGLRPALLSEEGSVRPLLDDAKARGRPVLASKDGQRVDVKPRTVLAFRDGIYPFALRHSRVRAFILCTAPEWGVSESSASKGFCGALRLDGKEVFRLPDEKDPSLLREPVGFSEDAKEALFALTKKRSDGAREIVGYRLWRAKKDVEYLAPDGARAKALVEKYEGPFLLPSQQQRGTGGH